MTGRAHSEPERLEFFGEIVDSGPGPESMKGPWELAPERQVSGPSEDVEPLPAPLLLKAGRDPVHSVAFSPDGKIVAAGDGMKEGFAYRGKLYLWETRSGKLIRSYKGFRRPVERICFSDNGKLVAASPELGGPVIVWQTAQEDRKAILRAPCCVLGLMSETEALVALEGWGGEMNDQYQRTIARWRFAQPLEPEDIVIQNAGIVAGLSDNKQVLFSCFLDGKVVFWSTGDWKRLGAIDVGERGPHAISADGRLFAIRVGSFGKLGPTPTLDVWDVSQRKRLRRCRLQARDGYPQYLQSVVFYPSGEVLAETYCGLLLRDLKTEQFFATWSPPLSVNQNEFISDFTSLTVSSDGEALAAGLFHGTAVALFRIAKSDLKRLRDTAKTSSARKDFSSKEAPDTDKG